MHFAAFAFALGRLWLSSRRLAANKLSPGFFQLILALRQDAACDGSTPLWPIKYGEERSTMQWWQQQAKVTTSSPSFTKFVLSIDQLTGCHLWRFNTTLRPRFNTTPRPSTTLRPSDAGPGVMSRWLGLRSWAMESSKQSQVYDQIFAEFSYSCMYSCQNMSKYVLVG